MRKIGVSFGCACVALLAACGGGSAPAGSSAASSATASSGSSSSASSSASSSSSSSSASVSLAAGAYYVSPLGDDNAAGTIDAPFRTFAKAQAVVAAGDTVYFRGGDYVYTSGVNTCASRTDTVNAIVLNKSGTQDLPIRYWAYPGETPKFDFSTMTDDCRVKGFDIVANWIYLKGLEISGAPQQPGNLLNNESWGVWINGSHNRFEQLNIHNNMGPGLFISKGGGNLVLNTDSHDNYDPYSKSGAGQNADGFGVHIGVGDVGNVFRGCRAWDNTDDGFDAINAMESVTIEDSWAWSQGYIPGTTTPLAAGNGNGFKVGGFGGAYQAGAPVHVIRFDLAFNNKSSGFYANHHPVASQFYNNTSVNNRYDFNFLGIAPDGSDANLAIARNNLAFRQTLVINDAGTDEANNSWNLTHTVTSGDFQNVSAAGMDGPRQADGSLPVLPNFRLAAGSPLVDAGVDLGFAYNGSAPDLGAFETTPSQ